MSFGDNLKKLRRDKGWTQWQLAENADLKVTHIPKLENEDADPKLSTLYKIANALGCSFDTLLMDKEKVGLNGFIKASMDRLEQLPDTQKYMVIDIIDALCMRNGIESSFGQKNGWKLMLYDEKPKRLIDENLITEKTMTLKKQHGNDENIENNESQTKSKT